MSKEAPITATVQPCVADHTQNQFGHSTVIGTCCRHLVYAGDAEGVVASTGRDNEVIIVDIVVGALEDILATYCLVVEIHVWYQRAKLRFFAA